MCLGLVHGGLAAGFSANRSPRKLTGRKLRVNAGKLEVKHGEEVTAARSFKDRRGFRGVLAAVVLLVYFGVSTLIEAASMEESKQEEEQQEAELAIAGLGASGAVAGTVAATFALLAVLGGSFLSNYVSEKVFAYVGGSLFLVFALVTLVETLS
ncbi:hypothetical protein R1sor_004596 [Riccia sorocarpa]|uniref:GDT1 family protein n=1 Tax=Riccia sorocarpa TaxID=122646 RepID=A0ABD3HH61_9MARC